MITILKNDTQKYKWIVQCSDIHIRLNKRKDEYIKVFDAFFDSIKEYPKDETIIVNTGDLFHTKLDLQPEGIKLAEIFLRKCADLFPTILIAGNHDCNLSNKNRLDSISPVVDAIRHPNLFYLKKSGLYSAGNICINNYSVFDSPENYIKGKDIPQIYRNKYDHFICLFHGQVDGTLTDLGFKLTNPFIKVDIFDNHDIALLGDIHKEQTLQEYDYNTGKPIIRYVGSLIQQNHGESLMGHGYTLWDLKSKTYNHVEIPNECGFFSVLVENGVITSDLTDIPRKTRVRLQLRNTTETQIKSALAHIRTITDVIDQPAYQRLDVGTALTRITSSTGDSILGDINDKNYQIRLISDYLKSKLNVVDQNIIDGVVKIHNEIDDNIKKDNFARNIRWIPIKFEWENMFSYGENNVIDFTKTKNLVGLFAANTSGKSSIFSALTFCLFDKCERESEAGNIMNTKKTTFSCKFEFEINGKRYFIKRDAETNTKGKVKVNVKFWKLENGKEVDLNGEQRRNTNEIIREYIGSYEDFVLTSLSVQNGKNNVSIIDMGNTDRKDLFAQFMGLTIFDRLYTEGNERLKERLVALKMYRNDDYTQKLIDFQNLLGQAENLYSSEQIILSEIITNTSALRQSILDTTKKLITIDGDIPKCEYSQMMLDKSKLILSDLKLDILKKEKEIGNVVEQLTTIELEITNLESKNVTELSSQLRLFQETKRNIEDRREQLKSNFLRDMKIFDKVKNIDYDPNCEFCIKHAGTIAQEAKEAKERMELIQSEASEIKVKLEMVEAKITEIQWSFDANLSLLGLLSKRNTLKDSRIKLTDVINEFKRKISNVEGEVKKHETNIELYNKNRESLIFNEEINRQIEIYNKELVQLEYSYKIKNKTIMDINSKISVCKNKISEIECKITNIKIIEQEYKFYEIYCQAVCRDGIPFDVITATVPEVQNEVNSILSQMSDFTALFETDGKNIIPYIVYNDRKWIMGLTSGFEKFALSLAIRVALINISNLPRPNFLIIDEGFGVLDSENLSSMNTLFTYLKTNFEFILIVSHLESFRDIVDSHMEIIKNDEFSHINYI